MSLSNTLYSNILLVIKLFQLCEMSDLVYGRLILSTLAWPCLRSPDLVYGRLTLSTLAWPCLRSPDLVYARLTLSTVVWPCLRSSDLVYARLSLSTLVWPCPRSWWQIKNVLDHLSWPTLIFTMNKPNSHICTVHFSGLSVPYLLIVRLIEEYGDIAWLHCHIYRWACTLEWILIWTISLLTMLTSEINTSIRSTGIRYCTYLYFVLNYIITIMNNVL